jgi:hypothetical protein
VVGPFDNAPFDKGLDAVYEPEKAKIVDLKAVYKGKSGEVKWTPIRHNGTGYVDLQAHFAPNSGDIASYLYQQLDSPTEQQATIAIGHDDGAKLWVNGQLVYTNREHQPASPDRNQVVVQLKKGVNTILLKMVNADGPHGFYFSVKSYQELKLVPVK